MCCLSKKYLSLSCLLVTGLWVNLGFAEWYNDATQDGYNQGYGDFPPSSIDEHLQAIQDLNNQRGARVPEEHFQSNPWGDGNQANKSESRDSNDSNPWRRDYRPPSRSRPDNHVPAYGRDGHFRHDRPFSDGETGIEPAPTHDRPEYDDSRHSRQPNIRPWRKPAEWRDSHEPVSGRESIGWDRPDRRPTSRYWDVMKNTPDEMGKMPGGWSTPSFTAPDPVDVGDEFEHHTRDVPGQMRNFNWDNNR